MLDTGSALLIQAELSAPVLLPARLILFGAELLFLAIADGANAAGIHACLD